MSGVLENSVPHILGGGSPMGACEDWIGLDWTGWDGMGLYCILRYEYLPFSGSNFKCPFRNLIETFCKNY